MKSIKFSIYSIIATTLIACGGGSGGSDSASQSGNVWLVEANVSADGCGDRISAVKQEFTISTDGDMALVDTSINTVQGAFDGQNIVAGYSEGFGDCVRNHSVDFRNINGDTAEVFMVSQVSCEDGTNCVNNWTGTAQRTAASKINQNTEFKVRGEDCLQPITQVGYRPSVFECNGAAAVLLRENQRNNYSVVVRRNGEFNDRDPNNPTCGTNECSPYKTQKKMELPEYQVNCMGDSGYSASYDPVLRLSIKFIALVTNANDPNQFEQYCINNVEASFN